MRGKSITRTQKKRLGIANIEREAKNNTTDLTGDRGWERKRKKTTGKRKNESEKIEQ